LAETRDIIDTNFKKRKFQPKEISNFKQNPIKTVTNNNRKPSTGFISQIPDKRESLI